MVRGNANSEDMAKAIALVLVIIFVFGGYLVAWLTIQKILLAQTMFWVFFWVSLICLISMVGFFIRFLLKDDSENIGWGYETEVFDKNTSGVISLGALLLTFIFFLLMLNTYQKGFSDESMQTLAKAQDKLAEFNYIKDALTGVEIERLMTENFDMVMSELCKQQGRDCQQLIQNYQSVKDIVEAKEKADELMGFMHLIERNK